MKKRNADKGIVKPGIARLCFVAFIALDLLAANTIALAAEEADDKLFSIIGRVVSVVSGDSIQMLLPDGERISIQLAGIESPAPDDPIGHQARLWLHSQLNMQLVTAECMRLDELLHCVVFPDDRNINLVSLYHGYSRLQGIERLVVDPQSYLQAERHARDTQVGVWNPGYQSAELD